MDFDVHGIYKDEKDYEGGFHTGDKNKPKVLVIDDDLEVREFVKLAIGDQYHIILCENGEDGISAVDSSVYAVVLDIRMTGKDGFDTYNEIKRRMPHLPIIFYTAYHDLKDPYEIMNQYRPFGYILKDGSYVRLMDTLRSAIDYYRQFLENQRLAIELQRFNSTLERRVAERTAELEDALARITQLSVTDSLTDLPNRRHFFTRCKQELMRVSRHSEPITLLLIDVDFFKGINDRYGHQRGDDVLVETAHILKAGIRECDIIGRIGGEEFAVLLINTDLGGAGVCAERLCKAVSSHRWASHGFPEELKLSISIGCCTAEKPPSRMNEFFKQADMALYCSKEGGRNRVTGVQFDPSLAEQS